MKRMGDDKRPLPTEHNLVVLVGTWREERQAAQTFRHAIGPKDRVAVPREQFTQAAIVVPALRIND